MAKKNTQFECQECGATARQWAGKCFQCGAWESMVEQVIPSKLAHKSGGYSGTLAEEVVQLCSIETTEKTRFATGPSLIASWAGACCGIYNLTWRGSRSW